MCIYKKKIFSFAQRVNEKKRKCPFSNDSRIYIGSIFDFLLFIEVTFIYIIYIKKHMGRYIFFSVGFSTCRRISFNVPEGDSWFCKETHQDAGHYVSRATISPSKPYMLLNCQEMSSSKTWRHLNYSIHDLPAQLWTHPQQSIYISICSIYVGRRSRSQYRHSTLLAYTHMCVYHFVMWNWKEGPPFYLIKVNEKIFLSFFPS